MPRSRNTEQRANFRTVLAKLLDDASPELIETPEDVAWKAWSRHGLLRDGETRETLKLSKYKLSPSEARDALARKRYIAVIKGLVDSNVVTEISQANDLLDLIESEYKGAANPAYGELNDVQQALPNYDHEWRDLESALWDELRAKEREAGKLASDRPLIRRSDALGKLKLAVRDTEGLLFIVEPEGAGKSVLLQQLRKDASDPRAIDTPALRFPGLGNAPFVYFDLEDKSEDPTDLVHLVDLAFGKLDPKRRYAQTLREACDTLVETLEAVRKIRPDEAGAQGDIELDELIIIDNAKSAVLAEALKAAIDATNAHVTVLVAGRDLDNGPKLLAALGDLDGRRFRMPPPTESESLAILTRGLGSLDEATTETLGAIAETVNLWPGALDAANRKLDRLAGRGVTISDLARNLQAHLAAHAARLRETLDTPNARIELIDAFTGAAPDDPFARFMARRSAYLVEDAQSLGYDLNRQFISLTISLPGGSKLPKMARGLSEALRLVSDGMPDARVFVLTAAPGAGKSTLFRRLEWEMVNGRLSTGDGPPPLVLFVPLNSVEPPGADPWTWLHQTWWPRHQEDLPSLKEVMASRPVWLLLDAVNELKRPPGETLDTRMRAWADRARELIPRNPAHRVIFSCRERDKGFVFRDAEAVELGANALDDGQMAEFLARYLTGVDPEKVLAELRRARVLDARPDNFLRLPLWLKLLADDLNERGPAGLSQLPRNKAALLSSLLRRRLIAERKKGTGPLTATPSLVTAGQWRQIDADTNHFLAPHGGTLLPGLEKLARRMMSEGTTLDIRRAAAAVGADAAAVLGCAQKALDLLRCEDADLTDSIDDDADPATAPSLAFTHQQFQEYFAGRAIARDGRIDPELVRPSFGEIGPWDEVALFAAAMVPDKKLAGFIEAIREFNLPLAARCAGQIGARERLDKAVFRGLREALQQRLAPEADAPRAERITCAAALFEVGHPDFEERIAKFEGKRVRFILPQPEARIRIPATDANGKSIAYWMGAKDLSDDERPRHRHRFDTDFSIARYPVTNDEFACFVEAGGYADPRWWGDNPTSESRRAMGVNAAIVEGIMEEIGFWKGLTDDDFARQTEDLPDRLAREWQVRRTTNLGELRHAAEEQYPPQENRPWPAFWLNANLNAQGQPVVGVDFYEARAYVRWLSAMCAADDLALDCNLPDEDQWEAACAGSEGRRWAADAEVFDPTRYNTAEAGPETAISATTPVGAFARGVTPEGVHDLSGNVWEWTLTEYVPNRARNERPVDRNDPAKEARYRVVRGGSWIDDDESARSAYRGGDEPPFDRDDFLGFRLIFRPC